MKIYLAHCISDRHMVREWELKMEEKYKVELVNPFYDNDPERIAKIDSGELSIKDVPPEVVDNDLAAIMTCSGLIGFVNSPNSYGTIMEIAHAHMANMDITLCVLNGYEFHPWLKHHSTDIFTSLEELEEDLELWIKFYNEELEELNA